MPSWSPRRAVIRGLGVWEPTAAQQRADALAAAGAIAAVLGRRPDLLVIMTPLVVAAAWGQLARPRTDVTGTARLGETTLREGGVTGLEVSIEPPLDDVHGIVTVA